MPLSKIAGLLLCLCFLVATHTCALAQAIVVGGKDFTEQKLVAEITGQFLRAKGLSTRVQTGFSTPGLRKEQELGLVDVYWEYTGTALLIFNNVHDKLSPDDSYTLVKELDARKGLIWLWPSRVDNTYALAMRRADAAAKGIASISDLSARIRQGETFRFAYNTEFFIRPDGLGPLQRAYRFGFGTDDVVRMDQDAIYDALREGTSVDVGLVFSTDGRIAAFDFLLLEDDRKFFPSYLLTPVARKSVLDQHPELEGHLNAISAKLDSITIAELNRIIDLQKREVEEVAALFLQSSGLL
jgi:osmoprotectant transport system substrate-binding protein